MGDGSWLFPLVRRNGHDRQFARVRGIACRAAYSGHGGVRRLPLLRKDFGAPRSGSGPRIRKRAHRRRSGMWPGSGNVFRRNSDGALRLAPLLHCPGPCQHGLADSLVCKTIAGVGAGSAGLLLLGCALAGPATAVILLLLAFLTGGMCGSNIWAITQTIAGPRMAGRWTGFQNFLGNLAGIIAPTITGFVVDFTGRFFMAFVIMAIIAMLAALSYFFVIGPVKEIAWDG